MDFPNEVFFMDFFFQETEGLISPSCLDQGFDQSVLKAVDPKHRRRVKSNHALVTIGESLLYCRSTENYSIF